MVFITIAFSLLFVFFFFFFFFFFTFKWQLSAFKHVQIITKNAFAVTSVLGPMPGSKLKSVEYTEAINSVCFFMDGLSSYRSLDP